MNIPLVALVATLALAGLQGAGKALRDTVAHHFPQSVFNKIRWQWLWKWFRSDWRDRPSHIIIPLWDAWHFGDFIANLAPVFWSGFGLYAFDVFDWKRLVVLYVIVYSVTFWWLYKRALVTAASDPLSQRE